MNRNRISVERSVLGAAVLVLLVTIWATVFLCACCFGSDEKLSLAILYAGHPGSEREADFVRFLKRHFVRVATGDLGKFRARDADTFDVVIMDYDEDFSRRPLPKLREDYKRSTVTIGGMGSRIGKDLKLKTAPL
jgi:hypothetical protein